MQKNSGTQGQILVMLCNKCPQTQGAEYKRRYQLNS